MTEQIYRVYIDDNFHFMDESERYASGTFASYADAAAHCTRILDDFLKDARQPSDTPDSLYQCWLMYGENPFIMGGTETWFSASRYVKDRCNDPPHV